MSRFVTRYKIHLCFTNELVHYRGGKLLLGSIREDLVKYITFLLIDVIVLVFSSSTM